MEALQKKLMAFTLQDLVSSGPGPRMALLQAEAFWISCLHPGEATAVHTSQITTWSSEVTTLWFRQRPFDFLYVSGVPTGPGLAPRTFHCSKRGETVSKMRVCKSRGV